MTTTHKISPLTVASMTTAETFYINPSQHLKTPPRIRQNNPKSLHPTAVNIQVSGISSTQRNLPIKNFHIALFKTT